jgi:manganese/zinc/iron transport system substrate-binding protein
MRILPIFISAISGVFATAWAQTSQEDKIAALTPVGAIKVVTTTNFITDLLQQIGGERVTVQGLMGPGVDPHLYKASAGDVRKMSQASVIFYSGLDLEGKMVELLERYPKAIAVTGRIPAERLRKPAAGLPSSMRIDPHVWFDVRLWQFTVSVVQDALSRLDPAGASFYDSRAKKYTQELTDLDAYIRHEVARIPKDKRVLITAHDAFGYFGDAYGFEVRGVQGISTVSEAGARNIGSLASLIAQRQIPAIFVESSVPRRTIDAVIAATAAKGFRVKLGGSLFSDAAGNTGTPEGTYTGMVLHNTRTITKALRSTP